MTKLRAFYIVVFCSALVLTRFTIRAQGELYAFVTDMHAFSLDSFEWASDSSRLAFYNRTLDPNYRGAPLMIELPSPLWQFFDVQAGTLSQPLSIWPLSPPTFHPTLQAEAQDEFVKVSPDGRYFFYTHQPPGQTGIPDAPIPPADLLLADNLTGETATVDLALWLGGFLAANPIVHWSASGDAAVMLLHTSAVGDILVTHIAITDTAPLTLERHDFKRAAVGSALFTAVGPGIDRIFDLSDDGNFVLLTGMRAEDEYILEYGKSQLVLWSVGSENAGQVIETFDADRVCIAAFAPGQMNEIMIITRDGYFYLYDIVSQEVSRLPIDSFGDCYSAMSFSPDGRWLAAAPDDLENRLVFVNVEELLQRETPIPSSPPTAHAGSDFFVEDVDGDGKVEVVLDGSGSSDADGEITHYRWGDVGGRGVPADAQGRISFEYDVARFSTTTYVLTVTDDSGLSDTDTVTVTLIAQ